MTRLKKRTVNHEKNILFLEGIVKILCLTICCTLYYNNIQLKKNQLLGTWRKSFVTNILNESLLFPLSRTCVKPAKVLHIYTSSYLIGISSTR